RLDAYLIWAAVLSGYALSRLAEHRIHALNYRILQDYGAEELIPTLMRRFYLAILFFIPWAALEPWLLHVPPSRDAVIGGLILLICGLVLRFWAIHSLGRLWSMRCMAIAGAPLVRKG